MRELASLELKRLAKELEGIEGFYLRKFYEVGKEEFELSFYKEVQKIVYAKLLKTINLSSYLSEHEDASEFAMQMRRRLENHMLEKVYQHENDRIIVFEFKDYKLIFEMFAKGNLILVDSAYNIIALYKRVKTKERSLDYKEKYSFPKKEPVVGSTEEILARLSKEKGDDKLISISKYFDYGPLYVENAILEAGLDPKSKLGILNEESIKALAKNLDKTNEEAMNSKPRLYKKEHDYALVKIKKYDNSNENVKEYDTLSALLDEFYLEERGEKEESSIEKEKESIKKSIEQQKELIKKLDEDADRYSRLGNAIMLNINQLNQMISYANKAKRFSIEELKSFETDSIKIIGIDLKNKKIKIKIIY